MALLIVINSFKPLAIVLSSVTIEPRFSVLLRMALAIAEGLVVIKLFKMGKIFPSGSEKRVCYSTIVMYFGLSLTYLSAQQIPSGFIALLYGLSPILNGVLTSKIKGHSGLSRWLKRLAKRIIGSTKYRVK